MTKSKLLTLLQDNHETFCLDDADRGETDLVEMHSETGEAFLKRQRARRMPFAVRTEVTMQLKKMQDTRVIRPSSSPWASPVVMVHNRDGSHRFCVDY